MCSSDLAGQLTTMFALVYAVASPVIAAAAGTWDRRTLLTAGMSVFITGMIVQATGPDFAAVAAGRVLAALDTLVHAGSQPYHRRAHAASCQRQSNLLSGCPGGGRRGRIRCVRLGAEPRAG